MKTLRETRALYGFSRIFPESDTSLADRKRLLWRTEPDWKDSWLPAYVVHSEGIFLELPSDRLAEWEEKPAVQDHVSDLVSRFSSDDPPGGFTPDVPCPEDPSCSLQAWGAGKSQY